MRSRPARRPTRAPSMEPLEPRALLSAVASPATRTSLTARAGALGQAVAFTVTVRDAATLGSPAGTVALVNHGTTVQTLALAPATSPSAKYDLATATYTVPAGGGGAAYYFGAHTVSATYAPAGTLRASHAAATFRVATPKFTTAADGLKVATVAPGAGPTLAAGQAASLLYTGYLVKDGAIFDDSTKDGGTPFQFTVDASPEQVIPGFDQGTLGMAVGETRVLEIPPALGYGKAGAGTAIPPNAKLVFLITLEAIS